MLPVGRVMQGVNFHRPYLRNQALLGIFEDTVEKNTKFCVRKVLFGRRPYYPDHLACARRRGENSNFFGRLKL